MRPHKASLSKDEKRDRRQVVHGISRKLIDGDDDNIIKKSLNIYPWLSRHMIHGCARRMKANIKKYGSLTIPSSEGVSLRDMNMSTSKGGHPVGTTVRAILERDTKKQKIRYLFYTLKLDKRMEEG